MDLAYAIKEARYYKKLNGLNRAFRKFLLTQTPVSKLVNTPIYNKIYSKKIKEKVNMNPEFIQIENTNLCNAKCVMCPHTIMKRKGKIMNLKDFKKIIDNIMKSYSIKRITITGFGEPFIDKEIIEKIKFLDKTYPKTKVDVYTNASLLDKKTVDELLKTNISRVTFSINGTERNYRKIMGLNYEDTKKNVLYFLEQKRKLRHPVLTNISLMILKENEEDVKNFISFWKDKADSVRVYPPSDWAGSLKNIDMITKNPFKCKRWPCSALWFFITVDVDGNVIMCCRDYESIIKFGNLLKQDIKEIRSSEKFKDLMQKHLEFNFSSPICKTCDSSFDSSLDWIC